ncbi:RNA-directed DNA polymerase, eukaryota, partial [Tanacetum coccineum]
AAKIHSVKGTTPSTIINDRLKIIVKGKVYWIRVKELEAWTPGFNNKFCESSSSDEDSVEDDETDHVSESSCMKQQGGSENQSNVSKQGITSAGPFGIYDILNRNNDQVKVSKDMSSEEQTFPPGFTSTSVKDKAGDDFPNSDQQKSSFHRNSEGVLVEQSGNIRPIKIKPGGSILEVMEDLVKIGQIMRYNTEGCMGQSTKKNWIREINKKYQVNFAAIQETKLENIDQFVINMLWGNYSYDFAYSLSVGFSGGIHCIWDTSKFFKDNVTISDSFLAIRGTWISSSTKLLIVAVYAPQDFSKRKILWDYIDHMIQSWEGECVILGDFNKIIFEHERFGTNFNDFGANAFNHFISSAGLIDLPLEGYSYTWALKSASKMSKLDRFLISEGLLSKFLSLSALCLDRNLSDHRPIIMRENVVDYGPSPFRFFHSWFNKDGFDKIVEDAWKNSAIVETNKISLLKKKLQALKSMIKTWCKEDKKSSNEYRFSMQSRLTELDKLFDKGKSNDALVIERTSLLKALQDLNARHSLDMAQKAKICWAIEGDENSKYFHGIINKKRSQLAIRGVLANGDWIEEPSKVKDEFLNHFSNRFSKPAGPCIMPDASMFKQISFDQNVELESNVNYEEIKHAVWDCGTNKSPGPDGFTFEFFRRYWSIINQDVVNVVQEFFASGSFYKIIAKILANRLSLVMSDLISDVQSAFVPNRQILDGPFILSELIQWCKYHKSKAMIFKADFEKAFNFVRWDYLDGIISNSGFIAKWRGWIQGCLNSEKGSILVNGSPSSEFTFHKGLKQGDPLYPFLFILDKANVISMVHMLNYFFMASGLKINILKSKLMGIGTTQEEVNSAAKIIGCSTFSTPFKYLGVKIYKAPMGVLHKLESIRRRFFNGVDNNERKINMIGSDQISLWSRLIRAIHGDDIINTGCLFRSSPCIHITRKVCSLHLKGINLLAHVKKKVGNGSTTLFWKDPWFADSPLINLFPRLFALECSPTRWVKVVPIKINIFAWKVCLDRLPTRLNLSLCGIDIPSISGPICSSAGKTCAHLLFSFSMAKALYSKVARWCEMDIPVFDSYEDWLNWYISLRFSKAFKDMLEDVKRPNSKTPKPDQTHLSLPVDEKWKLPNRFARDERSFKARPRGGQRQDQIPPHSPFIQAPHRSIYLAIFIGFESIQPRKDVQQTCGYVEKGVELVEPYHPLGFPVFSISDIAMGNIHTTGCSRINKILNGVLRCSIWAIWKLRNRIINVEPDMVRKVKDEDIFPFIRRTSKLWISVRLNLAAANWNRWISRPYDILSSPSPLTQTGMVDFVSGRPVIETAQRKCIKYEAKIHGKSLDEGFAPLMSDEDVLSLLWHVPRDKEIEVYVENGVSLVEKKMMEVSLNKGKGVFIEEIVEDDDVDDVENENEASTSKVAPLGEGCGTSEIDNQFHLILSQDPKEKVEQGMQGDLHTLNDDDDLLQLDDPIVWQHDNYHGHNEEEEIALVFTKLDQLLEHVYFLNVKLRESLVGVAPLSVAVDGQVVPVDAPVVPLDGPVIALEDEIQIPRKRKRDMEDENASAIVTFGRANKRRRLNLTDKTEKGIEDKSMEANDLGFHF